MLHSMVPLYGVAMPAGCSSAGANSFSHLAIMMLVFVAGGGDGDFGGNGDGADAAVIWNFSKILVKVSVELSLLVFVVMLLSISFNALNTLHCLTQKTFQRITFELTHLLFKKCFIIFFFIDLAGEI